MRVESAIFTTVLLVLMGGVGAAEDWPRWRGPRGDGISNEARWKIQADSADDVLWTSDVGIGFSSVVVMQGNAYTLGHVDGEDVVSCLDTSDGSFVWQHRSPAPLDDRDFEGGPTATPTIDGDRVFAILREGDLICFDASTGDVVWKKNVIDQADVRPPGWGFSAAPIVVDDRLLVNAGESGVAVDKRSGQLIWKSKDRECGYASPVLIPGSDPKTAVIGSGRSYVGVHVDDGTVAWSERWLTSFNCNAADPIFHDGKMFLSSGYNRGSALFDLSGETPELVWKSKEMKNQIHTSILFEGNLYGIDGDMDTDARLRCMDWNSGEIRWTAEELRPGGFLIAGDRLIVLTQSGEVVVGEATPEHWQPSARAKILDGKCWTTPTLADGRLYCRAIDGQVVCVDCTK